MEKPKEQDNFISTSCAGEVIRLTEWYDVDDEENPTKITFWQLCLSFYDGMNCGPQRGFLHKLRHICYIITTGNPWKDEVILDLKSAKELKTKLTSMISKAEKLLQNNDRKTSNKDKEVTKA